MESRQFFSLLRSFANLDPIQQGLAQEYLRHHPQRDQLHQELPTECYLCEIPLLRFTPCHSLGTFSWPTALPL